MRSYILWGIFTWIAQGEGLKIPPVRYCPIQLFQATGVSNKGRFIVYINWLRRSHGYQAGYLWFLILQHSFLDQIRSLLAVLNWYNNRL